MVKLTHTFTLSHSYVLFYHCVLPDWWGDKGYIKLSMKSDNPSDMGQCGVYREIASALVK